MLAPGRLRRLAIVVLAVNAVLYLVSIARGHFPFDALGGAVLPDFIAHLTGGTLVARGGSRWLYDVHEQAAVQLAITGDAQFLDLYLSPPLASLLYVPFAYGSYAVAAIGWTATTLALLLASARVLRRLMPTVTREHASLFLLLALASQPVIQLLGSGQDSGVSLLLAAGGVALALARRDVAAGLVMSLGLFKPQLFFMPPIVFVVTQRWRALGAWIASATAQVALTIGLFGVPVLRGWWAILHSPEYLSFLRGQRSVRMSSLSPLLESVVPASPAGFRLAAASLGGALSAVLVCATFWRMARAASAASKAPLDERRIWALAWVTTLLATPHLFDYDLTLLALPVALLLQARAEEGAAGFEDRTKWSLVAIYVLTWTVAVRAGLESSPWPVRVLAASWVAVPMLELWRQVPIRRLPVRRLTRT